MRSTDRFMRQPLVRDDHLRVRLQARLDPARLPVPEHDVATRVATADPLAVGREPDLARVTRDRVPREPLLAVLPEVVSGVDEDLVVEGLRSKVFL
jgi:hypothetical protein